MLVFFIHGVNTQNAGYANHLIENIRNSQLNTIQEMIFYGGFWGNLFNNFKHQTVDFIKRDISHALTNNEKLWPVFQEDIYRYKERRFESLNNFLGDFLLYQNHKRSKIIRETVIQQFFQFIQAHSRYKEVHFVAHSLGSLILYDLLFSQEFEDDALTKAFRSQFHDLSLVSITTLGSPLLLLKQFVDIDFSNVHLLNQNHHLRWVNIIHSSDLIAYPLRSAIENEISSNVFFCDQYVWLNANNAEAGFRNMGQTDAAMVVGSQDAHSSYFQDNLDGRITGKIITRNLLGHTEDLAKKSIYSSEL